jgi:hypothetical protein
MLSGCDSPANDLVLSASAGAEQGGVLVALSPTAASFDREQTQLQAAQASQAGQLWQLWIDGRRALLDGGDGHPSPVTVAEGARSARGYLEAGPHHFALMTSAAVPAFEGDAQVPSGGTIRLFVFGPLEALQGRFVSTPDEPASGNEHVTVVNLLRTGQAVEVVTCTGPRACTPVSSALGLGDLFDTEVPLPADGAAVTMTSDGVGIGYRAQPSPSMPAPPVLALGRGPNGAPAVFVAAPVYMSDEGEVLYGFN